MYTTITRYKEETAIKMMVEGPHLKIKAVNIEDILHRM